MSRLRNLIVSFFIFILVTNNITVTAAGSKITVSVDGKQIASDVDPIISNSRTLVPVRAIFEALQMNLTWDESTSTITALRKSGSITTSIKLVIGSNEASITKMYEGEVNTINITIGLDTAPQIINSRTLVPVRFIAEATGARVQWDEKNLLVSVQTKEEQLAIVQSSEEYLDQVAKAISEGKNNVSIKIISNYYDYMSPEISANVSKLTKSLSIYLTGVNNGEAIVYLDFSGSKPAAPQIDSKSNFQFDNALPINTYEDIYTVISKSLENCIGESIVELKGESASLKPEEIVDTVKKVADEMPNVQYYSNYSVKTQRLKGKTYGIITINYPDGAENAFEMKKAAEAKAKEIINEVMLDTMGELDRERALHDWVVLNTTYDYENYINNTVSKESYTPYGILIKGTGVCEGYAQTMKLLLKLIGIDSIVVSGYTESGSHAWNIVKVDGKYYHLDATWDDPVPDKGKVRYDYFNVSDDQISRDHGWDRNRYPKCDGE